MNNKVFQYEKLKTKMGLPYYYDSREYKHINRHEPQTEIGSYLYNHRFNEGTIGQNVKNIGAATNNINALIGELLIRDNEKKQKINNEIEAQPFSQILKQIETQLNELLDNMEKTNKHLDNFTEISQRIQELERRVNLLEEIQFNNNKLLKIIIEKLG